MVAARRATCRTLAFVDDRDINAAQPQTDESQTREKPSDPAAQERETTGTQTEQPRTTTGAQTEQDREETAGLPDTAGELPLLGLIGVLSAAAVVGTRFVARARSSTR